MNSLTTLSLGDLIEFQRGYDLPKSEFKSGNVPVISSNGILGYHNEVKVKAPGITIGRSGTVGLPHFIEEDFFPHNTSLFIKDFKTNDPKYIFYLLKNLKLNDKKSGSGVPTMNRNHLHPLKIKAYSKKDEQQKIANVLSSLDSKIELNNKINKELETMAKTLYDYWFVQFDFPDENGQPYKSSGGKMVYSEELKREIPKGWVVKNLEEICEIYQPQTISEKEMIRDGKYFVFGANGIVGMYDKYNHENSEVTITCRGNSCGTLNRTLPYSWITGNAMVVRFKDDRIHNEYLMNFLNWTKMDNVITGSAQPQITRTNLAPLKVLIPETNILNSFSQKMEFNVNLQLKNIEQNQELSKLRDWLLPMLMNGQVRVK